MDKAQFIEELRNLVYSAWVAGEPWSGFGLSWDDDQLHILVDDKVFVLGVAEYGYEDLVKLYGDQVPAKERSGSALDEFKSLFADAEEKPPASAEKAD